MSSVIKVSLEVPGVGVVVSRLIELEDDPRGIYEAQGGRPEDATESDLESVVEEMLDDAVSSGLPAMLKKLKSGLADRESECRTILSRLRGEPT